MKVIKPLKLGVLTRCFEFNAEFHMGISIMAFIPLSNKQALLSETGMWKFCAEQLGKEGVLEMGIPKARPEFLVTGKAYPPNGKAKQKVGVRVRLGEVEKTLFVFGDRHWQDNEPTQPEPFTEMPLNWAQSYGGKQYVYNPLGKGYVQTQENNHSVHWLANIEHPMQRVLSVSDEPSPACFAPIDLMWPQRTSLQGTYDDEWLENHYPGIPPDVDWGFFNIASRDQQFDNALQGDEAYLLENMHPEYPIIEGRLPGLEARCYVTQKTVKGDVFKEVSTNLRTIWFFPNTKKAILIFQGSINVAEEDGADILHLVLGAEYKGSAKDRNVDYYNAILTQRLDKEKGAMYALRDSDLLPDDLNTPDPDFVLAEKMLTPKGFQEENLRRRTEVEQERTREMLRAQNLDVDKYGPKPLPKKEQVPTLDELPDYIEKKEKEAREQRKKLEALKPKQEEKLIKLCEEHNLDYAEMDASMKKAGWCPPKLTAVSTINQLKKMASELKEKGQSPAQIEKTLGSFEQYQEWIDKEKEVISLYRLSAHFRDKPPLLTHTESKLLREKLGVQVGKKVSVAEQDYLGVDLSNTNLQNFDLRGIYLAGANLNNTDLSGADLSGAVLAHTSLQHAILDGAILNKTNLGKSDMRNAKMRACQETNGLILAGADLSGANLSHSKLQSVDCLGAQFFGAIMDYVNANQVTFLETKLKGASFQYAQLNECNFIKADVSGVNFLEASLLSTTFLSSSGKAANFQQAVMNNVRFVEKCDFSMASFEQAQLNEANLRGTELVDCDFQKASMKGADFSECNLQRANLDCSLAQGALFTKTDLREASMQVMDLMGSIMQWSDMRGTDFRKANLYQADFARVWVDQYTQFDGANTEKMRVKPKRFRNKII